MWPISSSLIESFGAYSEPKFIFFNVEFHGMTDGKYLLLKLETIVYLN
jgi:hypothetical protein